MKKIILVFLVLFVWISASHADNVYDDIASQLALKLHTVKGTVIKADKQNIVLNKGLSDGLYKNSIVYIYKDAGKLHLENKDIQLRKGVAYAYISKVEDKISYAAVSRGIDKQKDFLLGLGIIPWGEKIVISNPKKGDKFIAGKKEYRVAVITRNKLVYQSLKNALEKTNRFYVIDPDELAIAITKNRINSINEKKSIKELADAVDADIVLLVSINRFKNIKYRAYNGYAQTVILANTIAVDEQSRKILLNNKRSINIPANNLVASNLRLTQRLTLWERLLDKVGLYSPYTGLDISSPRYKVLVYKEIGHGSTALYVGNIGFNQNDIIVAKGSDVSIYRFNTDSFEKVGGFSFGYNIFNIDSAKIGSKRLITISNFNRYGSLESAVGYIDKSYKFHIIKGNLPYHLRFYNRFSTPMLIAQAASITKAFYGHIYKLDLNSGALKRLMLPINADSFYDFERIDNKIAYVSKSGQLSLYNLDKNKVVYNTPYIFGVGQRPIQRYDYDVNDKLSLEEAEAKNNVYIKKGVVFFKKDNSIYALGKRNYISQVISLGENHYNAYNIKLLKYDNNKFEKIYSSGDVKGRILDAGMIGGDIIAVVGLPAGFFDRFIMGIDELDRLVAAEAVEQ